MCLSTRPGWVAGRGREGRRGEGEVDKLFALRGVQGRLASKREYKYTMVTINCRGECLGLPAAARAFLSWSYVIRGRSARTIVSVQDPG